MAQPATPLEGLTARSATVTVVAQSAARGITLAVVVLSTAIVARAIGVTSYADWVTVLSLVALASVLLDPALSPVIVRRLAQEPDTAPTPAATLRVRFALGVVVFGLVVGLTVALRGGDALWLAVALGGQVVPRALVLNATPWLQADHRLHRQTVLEALCATLGLAGLSIGVAAGASAVVLAALSFTIPTAVLAALMRRELRLTPSRRLSPGGSQRERLISVSRELAPIAGALVLTTIYSRVYTAFVNAAETTEEVARFLFAFLFVEQAFVVSGILAAALLPLLAVRGRARDLLGDALTHDLCVAVAALGAIGSAASIALASPLCRLVGGPDLAAADRYLQLLAPMFLLVPVAFVLGYLHLTVGLGRRYLWINAVALVANLAGNAVFTLSAGAEATARVSCATEALAVALGLLPILRSGRSGRLAIVRIAVMVVVSVACAELAGGDRVAPWVLAVVVLLVAAGVAGDRLVRFGRLVRGRA